MPVQDPSTRRYVPSEIWGDCLWGDLECHISGLKFVLGRCDACGICECSGQYDEIEMTPCSGADVCYRCREPAAHGDAIIIATDGACRNNGRPDAIAGCGIFCSVDSIHNKSFQIEEDRPTSQRAELFAVIYALRKAKNILGNGGFDEHISEVVIKTDSAYVVNGMTSWIIKWRGNGYLNARGLPVANNELYREIDCLCDHLANIGVQARFWQVPRHLNMQADKLANAALDNVNWKFWDEDDWFEGGTKPYIHE